jgi:YCII-related domain
MSSFILLYNGPPTPPGASHEGWPGWFQRAGDKLVDMGSPMTNGFVVHSDGTTTETATSLNGYSIIRAEDRDEALDLVKDHPFLALGDEFTIEAFEVPNK